MRYKFIPQIGEIEKRLKNKAMTPMRVKPSPMVRTPKSPALMPKTPLKPVPRGLSVKNVSS